MPNRLNKVQEIDWPQEPKVIENKVEEMIMKSCRKLRYNPDVNYEQELNTLVSKVANIFYTYGKISK